MSRKFPITISIDETTLQRLDELAALARKSRSEIVRQLINDYLDHAESVAQARKKSHD